MHHSPSLLSFLPSPLSIFLPLSPKTEFQLSSSEYKWNLHFSWIFPLSNNFKTLFSIFNTRFLISKSDFILWIISKITFQGLIFRSCWKCLFFSLEFITQIINFNFLIAEVINLRRLYIREVFIVFFIEFLLNFICFFLFNCMAFLFPVHTKGKSISFIKEIFTLFFKLSYAFIFHSFFSFKSKLFSK